MADTLHGNPHRNPGHASPSEDVDDAVRPVPVARFLSGRRRCFDDQVAREEPLEIQLGGTSLAVIMRTPGHDEELVLGFLVTERVISSPSDVQSVRHCSVVLDPDSSDNVIRVILKPSVRVDLQALRRNLYVSTSCGICGKATIENALRSAPALDDPCCFAAPFFEGLPASLKKLQTIFSSTGGLHAAGLFAPDRTLLVGREDVGRHNAVDKVIGWALRNHRLPLRGHVLVVSGRVSYEIVQKALAARIPVVAAVSAPTSLAVDLAERAGMGLVCFLRGRRFNVYANRQRVSAD